MLKFTLTNDPFTLISEPFTYKAKREEEPEKLLTILLLLKAPITEAFTTESAISILLRLLVMFPSEAVETKAI